MIFFPYLCIANPSLVKRRIDYLYITKRHNFLNIKPFARSITELSSEAR